jgi:hypothetical protein
VKIIDRALKIYFAETGKKSGMNNQTHSFAQYFSWINNTNEGATEAQTLINLEFFKWLYDEFGMHLEIYAFDAGNLDGPHNVYGKFNTFKFNRQFPNGFKPITDKARSFQCRLGMWGGPDGFGNTSEEEKDRRELMVSLCRDYDFGLFKFDGVCGQLRPEKQDAFVNMVTECRKHMPELIILNHRLPLGKGIPYVTTFLMGGMETYIDIHCTNNVCAPHHRVGALDRAPPDGLIRLTEDHGVCISSCIDYWEDDLIYQAFNRCLILAPEIYGNPWMLPDEAYPKLARIFNLHRKYRDILVNGMVLPKKIFGQHAVSRGNGKIRFITMQNLSWEPITRKITLNELIGLENCDTQTIIGYRFHPSEKILGEFHWNEEVTIEILPFRSILVAFSQGYLTEYGVIGCDYEIIREIEQKPIQIKLLGMPGTKSTIQFPPPQRKIQKVTIDGKPVSQLEGGSAIELTFPGELLQKPYHRKLGVFQRCAVPSDAEALYETTIFSLSTNALEIQEIDRIGPSKIPQVQKARQAFLDQPIMIDKGCWDKYAFDGDRNTHFRAWIPSKLKYSAFRIDFGEILRLDRLFVWGRDLIQDVKLHPDSYLVFEASRDLYHWDRVKYFIDTCLILELERKDYRYIRISGKVDDVAEVEGYIGDQKVDRIKWRATNLFASYLHRPATKAWRCEVILDEIPKKSYLAINLHGYHDIEGAYVAARMGEQLIGAPDRAPSYPANYWESWGRLHPYNNTYYIPLNSSMKGKPIQLYILGLKGARIHIKPDVYITAYPIPFEEKILQFE